MCMNPLQLLISCLVRSVCKELFEFYCWSSTTRKELRETGLRLHIRPTLLIYFTYLITLKHRHLTTLDSFTLTYLARPPSVPGWIAPKKIRCRQTKRNRPSRRSRRQGPIRPLSERTLGCQVKRLHAPAHSSKQTSPEMTSCEWSNLNMHTTGPFPTWRLRNICTHQIISNTKLFHTGQRLKSHCGLGNHHLAGKNNTRNLFSSSPELLFTLPAFPLPVVPNNTDSDSGSDKEVFGLEPSCQALNLGSSFSWPRSCALLCLVVPGANLTQTGLQTRRGSMDMTQRNGMVSSTPPWNLEYFTVSLE